MTTNIFKKLNNNDDISKVISNLFELDLNIAGGWGYDQDNATIVSDVEPEQFYYTFAMIRANIEMNINNKEKYAGINVTLNEKETLTLGNNKFVKLSFKITAIEENIYKKFINIYKKNYGQKGFDLEDHFEQRKNNTIIRNQDYWFKINS